MKRILVVLKIHIRQDFELHIIHHPEMIGLNDSPFLHQGGCHHL